MQGLCAATCAHHQTHSSPRSVQTCDSPTGKSKTSGSNRCAKQGLSRVVAKRPCTGMGVRCCRLSRRVNRARRWLAGAISKCWLAAQPIAHSRAVRWTLLTWLGVVWWSSGAWPGLWMAFWTPLVFHGTLRSLQAAKGRLLVLQSSHTTQASPLLTACSYSTFSSQSPSAFHKPATPCNSRWAFWRPGIWALARPCPRPSAGASLCRVCGLRSAAGCSDPEAQRELPAALV